MTWSVRRATPCCPASQLSCQSTEDWLQRTLMSCFTKTISRNKLALVSVHTCAPLNWPHWSRFCSARRLWNSSEYVSAAPVRPVSTTQYTVSQAVNLWSDKWMCSQINDGQVRHASYSAASPCRQHWHLDSIVDVLSCLQRSAGAIGSGQQAGGSHTEHRWFKFLVHWDTVLKHRICQVKSWESTEQGRMKERWKEVLTFEIEHWQPQGKAARHRQTGSSCWLSWKSALRNLNSGLGVDLCLMRLAESRKLRAQGPEPESIVIPRAAYFGAHKLAVATFGFQSFRQALVTCVSEHYSKLSSKLFLHDGA